MTMLLAKCWVNTENIIINLERYVDLTFNARDLLFEGCFIVSP